MKIAGQILRGIMLEARWIVKIQIIVDKQLVMQFWHIVGQHFRIIGNHRAVVVIVAKTFIHVVAHARIEDGIHIRILCQFHDVAMGQLGRIACGITWDGTLTFLIQLTAGNRGYLDTEAKGCPEGMPEWQQLIHVQT